MKPTAEEIGSLLSLKRHETPEEGYMDRFLVDFHQRLREEEVRRRGLAGWWQRVTEVVGSWGGSKWTYAGGLAYAAAAAFFLLAPRSPEVQAPVTPVSFPKVQEVRPEEAPLEQLKELDLRPSTKGERGEQVF